ncbi:hypothetical protein [Subtercola vilae]|uniref:hypothetical protein n=1 Tax=Subtercola vilae TaxID=2056433 RepID=UPI0010A9B589|nr:hypothetical protein [Subtercola vilae]
MTSSPARAFRFLSARLLVLVAIAAALMGLFALHTMNNHESMPGHDSMSAASTSAVSHAPADSMRGTAAVPVAATALALPLIQEMSMAGIEGCPGCAMQCAVFAMSCVILIILSLVVAFARFAAISSALVAAGRYLLPVVRAVEPHLLRPSLVALSISRT